MTDLFQTVLNMSITGAYIAAAIIILRLGFKKLPKKYSYALWLILGIRLLCPVSFSSAVSMFNILEPETADNQMTYISQDHEYPPSSETTPVISDTQTADEITAATENAADKKAAADIFSVCSWIWIAGVCIMTAYSAVTYILVHKKVSSSELMQDNVYISKNISSPFVYGIVKPKIYLSSNIPAYEIDYILAHEKAHIKRGDHIVKIIALAALSVHWFNPFVWVSYKLMVWDMELSCDDIALCSFEQDVRKEYANTLLNMSLRQNKLSLGGILAFGETNIKSRVKSVLSSKKPRTAAIVLAVVIVITAAVCLLTNAESRPDEKLINISDFESFGICEHTDYAGYSDVKPVNPDRIIDFINSCEYRSIEDETAVELLGATSYSLRMYYGPDREGEYKSLWIYSPAEQQNPNCFIISDNVSGRKFYQLSELQFAELALMFTASFDGITEGTYISDDGNFSANISAAQSVGDFNIELETEKYSFSADCSYDDSIYSAHSLWQMGGGLPDFRIDQPIKINYNDDKSIRITYIDGSDLINIPSFYYKNGVNQAETDVVVSETETATLSEELPQEYLSLCGGYLTDLWNDIADKGKLDINKYTSDSDMIRLFETISKNREAEAAPTEFDRLETVFGSDNVSYGTADDKTWIYINYYEVLWWSGDEIIQRKEGYDAYFELIEINGRTEIVREYELWQLVPIMGLNRNALTYPLDIDISDVISCYEIITESEETNSRDMTENDWELKLYAEKTELTEGEPLNVYAELKYIGEQDEVKVYGSFDCVHFSLEGDRYFTDGQGAAGVPSILVEHTIKSGEIIRTDYTPAAGWSADDPDSDFYEQYGKADEAILPVGKYTLTAYTDFASDENYDNSISVTASVEVTVHAE